MDGGMSSAASESEENHLLRLSPQEKKLLLISKEERPREDLRKLATSTYVWILLYLVSVAFSFTFLVVYLSFQNDYKDLNQALNDQFNIDPWIDFVILFGALIILLCVASIINLLWNVVKFFIHTPVQANTSCCQKCCCGKGGSLGMLIAAFFWILCIVTIILCFFGIYAFYDIYQSFQGDFHMFVLMSLPVAQPILIILLAALFPVVGLVFASFARKKSQSTVIPACGVVLILLWSALFVFLWVVPFAMMNGPYIRSHDGHPTKPVFIAHRLGASLGPENTLQAFNKTVELAKKFPKQIFAVETDVRISADGVPFLLHDNTFRRTSNAREVFGNPFVEPESLNFTQIEQLDVGSWFVDTDPFDMIGSSWLSIEEAERYRGAKVPSLLQLLTLLKQHENLKIIWDQKSQPPGYLDIIIKDIKASHTQKQILFLVDISNNKTISRLRAELPEVTLVLPNDSFVKEEILDAAVEVGFKYINMPMASSINSKRRAAKKLTVIGYVCNVDWMFQQLWLVNAVRVVTSNVVQNFLSYQKFNAFTMARATYVALSTVLNIVVLAFVVVAAVLMFNKSNDPKSKYYANFV